MKQSVEVWKLKVEVIKMAVRWGKGRRMEYTAKNEKQDSSYSGATIHAQF